MIHFKHSSEGYHPAGALRGCFNISRAPRPFPSRPQWELITRIHHRSDAFGLMAEDGGSNALGLGWRYSF